MAIDNIQMVDLKGQYVKIKDQVDAAILNVIDTTAFIKGPDVKDFQEELQQYLGVKHVIPCGNGTDALQIALMALGLKPGDEVITANFTFAATVEVIGLMNLVPVFVDVDRDTFNINVEELKKAITPKTPCSPTILLISLCDADCMPSFSNLSSFNFPTPTPKKGFSKNSFNSFVSKPVLPVVTSSFVLPMAS